MSRDSLAACAHARITPRIAFESGQFSSLVGMVAAGFGISLVPEIAIDRNAGCRYVRLSDARATRTIVAAVLRGRSFNRVQQAFLSGITNKAAGSAVDSLRNGDHDAWFIWSIPSLSNV